MKTLNSYCIKTTSSVLWSEAETNMNQCLSNFKERNTQQACFIWAWRILHLLHITINRTSHTRVCTDNYQLPKNNLECTHSNAQHPFLGPIFVPGWLDLSPGLLTQGISGLLSWNWFNIAQPPVKFMPYRIWHILQTLTLSDSSWETERASCNFTQAQMSDDRDLLSAALARLWISRPACIQQPETMTDRVWERRSLNIWSTVHCSVWYEMISHSYATERALRNAEDRSVKSLSCFVCRWTTK